MFCFLTKAQTINFTDSNFKAKLVAANTSNSIAKNLNGNYFKIDINHDGEIQQNEALQVSYLEFYLSNISSLEGIQYFTNLTYLICEANQITSLNFSNNTALQFLNCAQNQLTNLNVDGNPSLMALHCSQNQISSLNLMNNNALQILDCSSNQITNLNVSSAAGTLTNLNCGNNQISNLNVSNNSSLLHLDCSNNQLTSLNLDNTLALTKLYCNNNLLSSLNVSGKTTLQGLKCINNQISNLNVNNTPALYSIECQHNLLSNLLLNNSPALYFLDCSFNQLTNISLYNSSSLSYFYCNSNQLMSLDVSNYPSLISLTCSGNQLTTLFIKNNKNENVYFDSNPNLIYICADDDQLIAVQTKINDYGYTTTCHVNSYCSFVPGGTYYSIQGTSALDGNNNGCESTDLVLANQHFTITNGNATGGLFANSSGNYTFSVQNGTHTITPVFENPDYFNASPTSATVTFPATASPFEQNFCITPNGVHHNVEITLLPLTVARPGFNATYKLVYKNTGNQIENGTVAFSYSNEDAFDSVSFAPSYTSQNLELDLRTFSWNYSNLLPLETRTILVVLNLNGPTEIPALNSGDFLSISCAITTIATDEVIENNSSGIKQIVVNAVDPNDKTCLEGPTVTPDMVNKYVHYLIRFENTGTYSAENIVVKDIIDTTKYDISTLTPIDGSHAFETRISNTNKVEFIFNNINLPFNDANNDGYVAFKIKTKPTLVLGDSFSNLANIYFDYNFPIITNTATTTIQNLGTPTFDFDANIALYPNPTKHQITLSAKNGIEITSVEVYNTLGQLILVITHSENNKLIDVSELLTGAYFLKVNTNKGVSSSKFIKE
jgi:Leucine-rich repeat (LRR) protein